MIGADIMVLLFGLGLLALAGLIGRVAVSSARAARRNQTILFGVGTVVVALIGIYFVALAVLRLIQN